MSRILTIGLSYRSAPIEVREKLSLGPASVKELLDKLSKKESIRESCIISTCNRFEIYCATDDLETCESDIMEVFSGYFKHFGTEFSNYLYKHFDGNSVKHLFRVVSSMDSMVVGEPQILGQVKEFYKLAASEKKVGLILNRLFMTAFFAAKKVRSETNISRQAISVSYLAVELARRIFEDLSKRKVMLIGTGEMSQLAAKHLVSTGINELYISSRNFQNALEVSENLNGIPIKFEETLYNLKNIDILITATGSSEYIINNEDIKQTMKLRKNDPIFLIDIAVPRDIDPKINDIPGVYLYDIDDLKSLTDENMKSRRESLEAAEKIVSDVHVNFMKWIDSLKVFPTIIELKKKMENIKHIEIKKAINKFDNISEREKEIVETLAQSIIGKIFHEPVTNLKKDASSYEGLLYSEVLNRLFELTEDNFELISVNNAQDWN